MSIHRFFFFSVEDTTATLFKPPQISSIIQKSWVVGIKIIILGFKGLAKDSSKGFQTATCPNNGGKGWGDA